MAIIGICRFSLVGKGDWKAFQGKSDEEAHAIALAQAAQLFTPERMEARLKTFELLTLASLRAQTDQDFRFVVLSSELMPQEYKDRLQRICDTVPQVVLRFCPVSIVPIAQRAVFRELRIKYAQTLQFRLDDDDCLCVDFIEAMKAHTAESMEKDDIFVASVRGVMYSSIGGAHEGVYHWPVDFMSAGAAIRHPSKSIYEFGHFSMATRFPNVLIKDRLSLVTHNGTNDTRFTSDLIVKRGMVKMTAEQVDEAVAQHFPFLTDDGRKAAGLIAALNQDTAPIDPPAPEAEAEETAPPAKWLNDLLDTKYRRGFLIADDLFALQHTYRSAKTLYVSFDNLSSVRAPSKLRDPWGYDFAAKSEWSSLGALCYRPNWFRVPRFHEEMIRLAESGFFAKFQNVIFSGTSMGAFAACTYASLAPGSIVIAFSPQSTLAPDLADWGRRYPSGTAADWSGPFADAADGLKDVGKAWIVYDREVLEDKRHAERLAGPNVELLNARHSSHFTAQFLRQVGVLKSFVVECAAGEMTPDRFYQLYRAGRSYRRYLVDVAEKIKRHPSPTIRARGAEALRKINKLGLANDVSATLP